MTELIANNSGDTEIGYWGRNDDNDNMNYADEDRSESSPGVKELNPDTPQDPIDSIIHNHFNDGNGTIPSFSPADIFSIYQLFINGRLNDTNDFVAVMTSPGVSNSPDDDTLYALVFDSESSFADFGSI